MVTYDYDWLEWVIHREYVRVKTLRMIERQLVALNCVFILILLTIAIQLSIGRLCEGI